LYVTIQFLRFSKNAAKMNVLLILGLGFLLSRASHVHTPAMGAARAPCPRRQLLTYVAFVAGRGAVPARVYTRDAGYDNEWQHVGRVAAGNPDGVDASLEALYRAAQLQQRLIVEHGCRIYRELREAKRAGRVEVGVELDGVIHTVPVAVLGDATRAQMLSCGFAGAVPSESASNGIYAKFARSETVPYDRQDIVAQLECHLAPSIDGSGPAVILFAWACCGYATKARHVLEQRHMPYTDVVIDKFSAMHAELAMATGRTSVPYIFERGLLLGGFEADSELPGLAGTLAKACGERARVTPIYASE